MKWFHHFRVHGNILGAAVRRNPFVFHSLSLPLFNSQFRINIIETQKRKKTLKNRSNPNWIVVFVSSVSLHELFPIENYLSIDRIVISCNLTFSSGNIYFLFQNTYIDWNWNFLFCFVLFYFRWLSMQCNIAYNTHLYFSSFFLSFCFNMERDFIHKYKHHTSQSVCMYSVSIN